MDAVHEGGGYEHADAAGDDGEDAVVVEEVDHDVAEEERRDDLRDDDEEVEDAHVNAGAVGGQDGGEDGVRHREDAGPGDAYADHAEEEHVF